MTSAGDSAVRSAERAVHDRKRLIAMQWSGLRERSVGAIAKPSTLGALALAGAVVGWRSAGKDKQAERMARAADEKSASRVGAAVPSMLEEAVRSVGVGVLRGFATMAIEELLRGRSEKAAHASSAATPQPTDVENGEVSGSSPG